jgi:hypothetical protein
VVTITPLLSDFTVNYMDMSYFTTRSMRKVEAVSSATRLISQRDIPHYPSTSSVARRKAPAQRCRAMTLNTGSVSQPGVDF